MASIIIYSAESGRCDGEQAEHVAQEDLESPLRIEYEGNATLAQSIWTDGRIAPPPLCSGLGTCGRCRVQFLDVSQAPQADASECGILGAEHIAKGWRLACRHQGPVGDDVWKIAVPLYTKKTRLVKDRHKEKKDNITKSCMLAVDLGTTSVHWEAILPSGEIVLTDSMLNPQMGAGSDIMSRIAYAMKDAGRQTLRRLFVESLRQIADELLNQGYQVTELCIAGNTAMTAIIADVSVESLAFAPYAVPHAGNDYIDLPMAMQTLDSSELPTTHGEASIKAWLPPQIAPFVGGDLSAGYVALCQEYKPRYPFLLADLGTNGEFVLALSPEKSLVTSVPLGPALEGIGMRHGAVASAGVITKFSLGPMGLVPHHLPELDGSEAKAQEAISGTGYLSLISTLLRAGILDEQGRFVQSAFGHREGFENCGEGTRVPLPPLAMRIAKTLYRVASQNDLADENRKYSGELRLPLRPQPQALGFSYQQARPHMQGKPVCSTHADTAHHASQLVQDFDLSGSDIEELLKVKAAFSLAVAALLQAAALPANAPLHIYIAGALGLHVLPHDLEALGFLPTGSEKRITAVGNTSLKGAKAFLLDHEQRRLAHNWATTCSVLDLTREYADFTQSFLQHMTFRFQ